ncbi:CRISPR-associated helicase Cas3' [uncultured Pseudacidovorax sp.]|uniref:CRISPR-associated helicase Cas3' n=1 Tax=uncultured Pseudacidovorax sp. TaxID=679313 RepID=UPI0025F4844B|nr:CRISPR-associated helicase Cas3' [uncultured Pseudacidovorax sp.]
MQATGPMSSTARTPVQTGGWSPWGKLARNDDGRVCIHPLLDHMVDVASVLRALLELPAIARAAEKTAGRPLTPTDKARLTCLAYLHDVGKANTGFQVRYWATGLARPDAWRNVREGGHGPQGWVLFDDGLDALRRITTGLPLEAMAAHWGESMWSLLHASISHHGRPVGQDGTRLIWTPIQESGRCVYDPADTVAAMGAHMQSLYPEAFVESGPELPDAPAFCHFFAGIVQLADWLGSDTRPGFFPYSTPGEDRSLTAPDRARHAIRAVGLDVGDAVARVALTTSSFAQAFGLPSARPTQAAMAEDGMGPVVILEAETGSGKTEAALWRFLHLWRSGHVDSLYLALPTRVAACQLYERVRDFVQRTWNADWPMVVRALPGYTAADGETPEHLPGFEVLWPDMHDGAPDEAAAEAERRWAAESPKRYLAAPLAVGTIDQALLGVLQIKHAHLRQSMLARSLLVVDEVHASDAYMTRLLEQLLRAHVACGGQALLLSATLGATARSRYLSIGGKRRGDELPPPLADAQAMPYPAISHRAKSGAAMRAVEGNPRHKTVHWTLWDQIDAPDAIAARAVEAAAAGARVLIVRNTVPAAVATLRAAEALSDAQSLDCIFNVEGVRTLHHSRFSRQDRPLLDAAVQDQIGKHRQLRGGLVVIGTQTMEQSLDIDADLLITDLCPMDVLLQRLGRLHRHERPSPQSRDDHRPAGFEQARAWVLTPPGHDLTPLIRQHRHGLGPIRRNGSLMGVYVDLRVLEATRRLVAEQPSRDIPRDNRLLVESATHPEALHAIARDMGESWISFGNECDGAAAAESLFASYHALAFDKPFDEGTFSDDTKQRVGTRLGDADRVVVLDPPVMGPFQERVMQMAIRHHLLPPDLALDAEATEITPLDHEPGFTFVLGSTTYKYSRFGIEKASS